MARCSVFVSNMNPEPIFPPSRATVYSDRTKASVYLQQVHKVTNEGAGAVVVECRSSSPRVLVLLERVMQQLVRAARHERRVSASRRPRVHIVQPDEQLEPIPRAVVVPQPGNILAGRSVWSNTHLMEDGSE